MDNVFGGYRPQTRCERRPYQKASHRLSHRLFLILLLLLLVLLLATDCARVGSRFTSLRAYLNCCSHINFVPAVLTSCEPVEHWSNEIPAPRLETRRYRLCPQSVFCPQFQPQPQQQPQLAASSVALIDASRRDVDVDVVSLVCPIWHVCPLRPYPSVCLPVCRSVTFIVDKLIDCAVHINTFTCCASFRPQCTLKMYQLWALAVWLVLMGVPTCLCVCDCVCARYECILWHTHRQFIRKLILINTSGSSNWPTVCVISLRLKPDLKSVEMGAAPGAGQVNRKLLRVCWHYGRLLKKHCTAMNQITALNDWLRPRDKSTLIAR